MSLPKKISTSSEILFLAGKPNSNSLAGLFAPADGKDTTMAIYGPHGSVIKPPKKVDSKISINQPTARTKYPAEKHLKKGRGRPRKQSLLITEPVILDVFRNLFPTKPNILDQIKENMKEKGFLKSLPIIVGKGPWTGGPFIVDGHTRYDAAKSLGIQPVYDDNIRYYETELDALKEAIYLQISRRNMTDAEIISCIEAVDKVKSPGRPTKELASLDANLDSVSTDTAITRPPLHNKCKSAKETAEIVGTSTTKVEKARVVLAAPAKLKEEVLSGKKSIHSASEEAKALKKSKTTPNVIVKSPASIASWMPALQVLINVAVKTPSSKEELIELEDKITSLCLTMEYNFSTLLLAGAYFRKFDPCWGPDINQIEALPKFFKLTAFKRFTKLVTRIQKEAKKAAEVAANDARRQIPISPELGLTPPITNVAKYINDDSQNVSSLVT